jgi:hypothetical protein
MDECVVPRRAAAVLLRSGCGCCGGGGGRERLRRHFGGGLGHGCGVFRLSRVVLYKRNLPGEKQVPKRAFHDFQVEIGHDACQREALSQQRCARRMWLL